MAEYRRGILYGDALILAGVQASLSAFPDLDIITLEELPAGWVAILQQPNLLLIGIGPDSAATLVLSSHPQLALSAPDLLTVIRDGAQSPTGGT